MDTFGYELLKKNSSCALRRRVVVWQLSIVSVWAQHTSSPSFLLHASAPHICIPMLFTCLPSAEPEFSPLPSVLSATAAQWQVPENIRNTHERGHYVRAEQTLALCSTDGQSLERQPRPRMGCRVHPMLGTWLNPIMSEASTLIFWAPWSDF